MANRIVLKRSSVATKVPLATDLEVGELAVNLVDQKLYSKKSDGTVILVGSGLGGAGDVQGPASSTDNAITVFDGTTGKSLKNSKAKVLVGGAFYNATGADTGNDRVYTNVLRIGDTTGAGGSVFSQDIGGVRYLKLRTEVDNPLGTTYKELNLRSNGLMVWDGGQQQVWDGSTMRFAVGYGTYNTAWFGPRVANDNYCSVMFSYDNTSWQKIDSTPDGFFIHDNSNALAGFRRGTGNLELRGQYRGYGSWICTFTTDINANTNREPGVWVSYAAGATNAPDISGILWNGMSGNGPTNGYISTNDGGQLWQNYSNSAFYTRKRWGGVWSAWQYIGG